MPPESIKIDESVIRQTTGRTTERPPHPEFCTAV
jgi:hypothetical protein